MATASRGAPCLSSLAETLKKKKNTHRCSGWVDTPLRASAAAVVPPLGSVGSASAGVHPRRQVGWGERSRTRRRTERCTRCISSRRSSLEGGERLSPSGGDAVGSCRAAAARPLPPPMVPVGAGAAAARRSGRRGGGGAPGMSVSARVQKCPATSAVRGTVRDGGRRRGGGGGQRRQRSTVAAVTGPHACATQRGHRPLPAPRPLPARRPHPARLLVGGEVLRPRGRGWGERDPRGRPPRPLPPRPPPARLRFPFRVVAAAIVVGGAYPHWRPGRRRRRPPHQTAADAGVLSQQRARASHDDCRRGCAPAMQGVGEG